MRVLFVNPHYTHDPYTLLLHPPLAYGYMANHLKARGHDVVHADLPFEGNSPKRAVDYLENYKPDIVGVTCVAQSYYQALEIAQVVKSWNDRTPVVFGGPHVSFIPSECLRRHRCLDYVLLFDAEHSMADLVDALAASESSSGLRKISGLAFREGAAVRVTGPEPPSSHLDQYGIPDRSIFDMERYRRYDYETVVMTARGCPSRCTFCSTTAAGRAARWHSPEHVVNEIEQVIDLGFISIFFGDDTFSGDPRRAIEICAEMQRRGIDIPWTSNMRAQDARPEVLDAMCQAGAYRVFVGFESIQSNTLRLVKKGTSPERLYKTARRIMAHGIELHASFIVGAPGDTHESLAATLDYIRIVNPTIATFNVMEPRPGTDVYRDPDKYGISIPNRYWYETTDWLDLPVSRTEELTQEEIRSWVHRCYNEFCAADFRETDKMAALEPVRASWEVAAESVQRHLPLLPSSP